MEEKVFNVVLGEYKGLHYTAPQVSVADAEVENALKQEQRKAAKMVTVGKAAEKGDTVMIDYAGFCEGVQFPGGTSSEPYGLVLGSNSFIPGFEDQLIGAVAGEERDVNVTFPKVYHEPSLAGKPAVFKCKVHAVQQKEIPALGDAFAQEHFGMSTLQELRDAIGQSIRGQKQAQAMQRVFDGMLQEIVKNSEITLSEAYRAESLAQMEQYYSAQLQQQGASIEMYCKYNGITPEQFREQLSAQADANAKNVAVLATVAETEGLQVSDEDFEAYLQQMAMQYRVSPEQFKARLNEAQLEDIRKGLRTNVAVDFILQNAIAD